MKRRPVTGRRYYLSKRYNVILLITYALILAVVTFGIKTSTYKRNLITFLMIIMMVMSMLRFLGVGKHLRFLDLILTIGIGMMLIGCKLNLNDMPGFFIVTFIGCLTMCVGGPFAWMAGMITLSPSLMQIWEKWQCQDRYWYEIMLGFCLIMMLISIGLPDNDHCEIMFLFFSFLSKAMIMIFVLV